MAPQCLQVRAQPLSLTDSSLSSAQLWMPQPISTPLLPLSRFQTIQSTSLQFTNGETEAQRGGGDRPRSRSHLGDTWSFPSQEKPLCSMLWHQSRGSLTGSKPRSLSGLLPLPHPASDPLILSSEQKPHLRTSLPLLRSPLAFS